MTAPDRPTLRIDKWLWQARFCKTRSLAATLVSRGRIRVNGQPVSRPGRAIAEGDVLTFAQGARVRVIKVRALGQRRGPAPEARELYDDLEPDPPSEASGPPSPLE